MTFDLTSLHGSATALPDTQIFMYIISLSIIIMQVLKVHSSVWSFILQPESDDEHFVDVDDASVENSAIEKHGTGYQMSARNPLYSKAETCCLWELNRLISHYHPSVQAFAKKLAAVS